MDINFGLGLFGAFGTVIGFLGFLFYLRDRRRVELRYEFINDILIGKEVKALPDGITIQYRGQPLKSLQKSNLILWNRSTQSIKQSDLARPLMVTFPATAEVFAMRIEAQSAEENEVRITARDENTFIFEFEYLRGCYVLS